jgi:chromosome segregation ATPase
VDQPVTWWGLLTATFAIVVAKGAHWSWRPSRHVLVISVITLVAVGLLGEGVLVHLDTRDDLRKSAKALTATRTNLAVTATNLKISDTSLADTKTQLSAETKLRKETEDELDGVQDKLSGVRGELDGVQGTLADADSKLNLQAGQIENLKTCLQGVSTALSAVADSDYTSALAALDAVESSCNAAHELF